jgi:hypothetical protein
MVFLSCIHLSSLVDVRMCFILPGCSKHVEDTIIKLIINLKSVHFVGLLHSYQISKNRNTIIYMIIQSVYGVTALQNVDEYPPNDIPDISKFRKIWECLF